ncbi:catechol 1,2-dioxygenase [Acetobacter sacchari]|uniref:catechol 1,2-dioxygenase n=2 Tax=Acetobacter sacchari TaxID=2661687 RepID=A0ABS3LW32_9PROT|nr:catechol 1,2-dioxygenase [Acetobacter sacchari]
MTMTEFTKSVEITEFLDRVSGLTNPDAKGDERTKKIIRKIVGDLYDTIDTFDVTDDEFWLALNFLAAGSGEIGLWAAGLGFEHFLDLRADRRDRAAGIPAGTPRTIEGPLYVAGAPIVESGSRLDDGSDPGEQIIMHGHVSDTNGKPVTNALVHVWHANTKGNYSFFDKSQTDFNMRRRLRVDENGDYMFHSIMPSGYACPPGGSTDTILSAIGRHGERPAHIHLFVEAPGYRQLTTQINIENDPYINDDFAYATRDELIPPIIRHSNSADISAAGLNEPYAEIKFDFVLTPALNEEEEHFSSRPRVMAD